MGFNKTLIQEVRNGGSDTVNGGGFDPGISGFATDLTATSATGTSPVVSSASYTFVSADISAWLFIKSGTNWLPGWYKIASVSAGSATLSATLGTAFVYNGYGPNAFNKVNGCASTASPSSGVWGIDYSQQDSPQISFTDMVIGGTTTQFTSVGNPAGPNMIGNMISITSGTGFTVQRVMVTAFTLSGLLATCDKSLGTTASTGGHGGLGGGLATIGQSALIANLNADNSYQVFINYSATAFTGSATANVAGGKVDLSFGVFFTGYNTSRFFYNTDALKPTFKCTATSTILFNFTGGSGFIGISNIIIDSNSQTNSTGVSISGTCILYRMDAIGFTQYAYQLQGTNSQIIECTSAGYTGGNAAFRPAGTALLFVNCVTKDNTNGDGFQDAGSGCVAIDCVAVNSHSGGFNSFQLCINCSTYNCQNGFTVGNQIFTGINCVTYLNSQYGFIATPTSQRLLMPVLLGCATGGNSLGNSSGLANVDGLVPLSANPYTNATASPPDLTLNATSGGGALVKAVEYPITRPSLDGTNYGDMGAFQSAGSGGGSGGVTDVAY